MEPKIVIGGPNCLGFDLNGRLAMNLTNVSRVTTAKISSPKEYAERLAEAKNPLYIIGCGVLMSTIKGKPTIDWCVEIAKAGDLPVCATGDTAGPLAERGLKPNLSCGILEISGVHLTNPNWKGVNGKGQHDWVLFHGIPCYFAERALTTLLRYSPWLKTYTICHRFHHSADFTWHMQNQEGFTRHVKFIIEEFEKIKGRRHQCE